LSFESEGPPLRTGAGGFRDGLAINLANPTIITFYLAIVPSFIPAGAPHFYFATLAAIHVTIAFVCHSMWAVALHAVRRWFAAQWARRTLTAATGLALIYLAARVLT
jgi:threonine/homoserine/homoserine lactone efflux protein